MKERRQIKTRVKGFVLDTWCNLTGDLVSSRRYWHEGAALADARTLDLTAVYLTLRDEETGRSWTHEGGGQLHRR